MQLRVDLTCKGVPFHKYAVRSRCKSCLLCFRVNDRILSANGVPLENVDYSTAVQVLRDSGHTVQLVVKRRVVLPPSGSNPNVAAPVEQPQTLRVSLARGKKKDGQKFYKLDIIFGVLIFFLFQQTLV
jgi:hypothetical protein